MVIVNLEGGKYIRKNHNFECMDNIQFWLYVIIAIIALLAQMRKKKGQQDQQEERPRPVRRVGPVVDAEDTETVAPARPLSFEDLLNEILVAKNPPKPEPQPVSYENYEIEEPEPAVTPTYYQEYSNKALEKSERMSEKHPTLTSSFDLDKSLVFNEHFKNYAVASEKSTASLFAEELKQHDGLRKAVIFSEILNRKHF